MLTMCLTMLRHPKMSLLVATVMLRRRASKRRQNAVSHATKLPTAAWLYSPAHQNRIARSNLTALQDTGPVDA